VAGRQSWVGTDCFRPLLATELLTSYPALLSGSPGTAGHGASKIFRLIEALEDSDVQNVYANFDVSDEVMEQVG